MHTSPARRKARIVLLALLAALAVGAHAEDAGQASADEPNHWSLAVSPYTHHWRYSAEHRPVWAVAIERRRSDGWLAGASFFKNSFGQPSSYVYLGRKYDGMLGVAPLFAEWTGGLMYGYKGKYQTKVPLNVGGYSPGFLLSAGWQFDRQLSTQLNLLGDAAVMWQLNWAWR